MLLFLNPWCLAVTKLSPSFHSPQDVQICRPHTTPAFPQESFIFWKVVKKRKGDWEPNARLKKSTSLFSIAGHPIYPKKWSNGSVRQPLLPLETFYVSSSNQKYRNFQKFCFHGKKVPCPPPPSTICSIYWYLYSFCPSYTILLRNRHLKNRSSSSPRMHGSLERAHGGLGTRPPGFCCWFFINYEWSRIQ